MTTATLPDQSQNPPASQSVQPPAAPNQGAGGVAQPVGEIKVVQPQEVAGQGMVYALPVSADDVASVEIVDVDMVFVLKSGERLLLPQGALNTALNPEMTKLAYANGSEAPAADGFKKVGLLSQVTGGSYRLQSSDLKPVQSMGGGDSNQFGVDTKKSQSEESADSSAQQASAELVKITQALQLMTQSQSRSSESAQGASQGAGTGTAQPNPYVPVTAGTPPKENDKPKTEDPNENKYIEVPGATLQREVYIRHDLQSKVSNVVRTEQESGVALPFGGADVGALFAANPLSVAATTTSVAPADAGNVHLDLVLSSGSTSAASVKLFFNPVDALGNPVSLPPGFLLNGAPLTSLAGDGSGGVTIPVNGGAALRLDLQYQTVADGVTVTDYRFEVGVQYFSATGQMIGAGSAPITFLYTDARTSSVTSIRDVNSNLVKVLPARGLSYRIEGTSGNDTIAAGDGHDLVLGGTGNDSLDGGAGDDTLIGGVGADTLDGGSGLNTASYVDSEDAVTVYLAAAQQGLNGGGRALGDQLANIRNLIGSNSADALFGDGLANALSGGDGNDTLTGGAGADTLTGGAGTNTAGYSTAGTGVIVSLANPAENTGDAAGDVFVQIQNILGSAHADRLIGDDGNNRLDGGGGNDTLLGGLGADTLVGGSGTNAVSYENAESAVSASLDDSTRNTGEYAVGDDYTDIHNLIGSNFDDRLEGDAGNNTLTGGNGNDTLIGGLGADSLVGGEGIDTASYEGAAQAVLASLSNPLNNTNSAAGDAFDSIENLTGTAQGDQLEGNAGNNYLFGGAGNDTLTGGGGNDTLEGGDGNDTASFANALSSVTVYLPVAQQNNNAGAAAGVSLVSIENLTGYIYADLLVGDSLANRLTGGAGDDTLIGGDGQDTLDGGDAFDTVSYAGAATAVTLSLTGGGTGGAAAGDIYVSIERVVGTDSDDEITGDSFDNQLEGGDGNDTLIGGGGSDTLMGGGGNDLFRNVGAGNHYYFGGDGINTVSYEGFATAINANLGIAGANSNGAGGNEFYDSIQNLTGGTREDVLVGNNQVNVLIGGNGNDSLYGMGGNDVLVGGDGDDLLVGGAGADQLNGETGIDTVSYVSVENAGVVIDLANTVLGSGRGTGDAAGDTFTSLEILEGSSFTDYIYAGNVQDLSGVPAQDGFRYNGGGSSGTITVNSRVFSGNTVDFSSSASAGVNVSLTTGTGSGGWAANTTYQNIRNLVGSGAADTLRGDVQANVILGAAGNDTIRGSLNTNTSLADTLEGGSGTNMLSYQDFSGTNRIIVDMSVVDVSGYFNVQIQGGQTDLARQFSHLRGTSGADSITGDAGNNSLIGSAGNDTLSGGAGADTLDGGDADDILIGGAGADSLIGGLGNNTASYSGSAALRASLSTPGNNTGDAADDEYEDIQNLVGTAGNDTLEGNAANNRLDGGTGDDSLYGLVGNDTLIGGVGSDTLYGGEGDDSLSGGDGDDVFFADAGADIYAGGSGNDVVDYREITTATTIDMSNLIQGQGSGTDWAAGDVIGTDIETVWGATANTTFVSGGRGGTAITMTGVADYLNTVTYQNAGAVTASLAGGGAGNAGAAANDRYASIQNLIGSAQADSLTGNDSVNRIEGGAGDDTLFATLATISVGTAGQDSLYGGTGNDTVSFANITLDPATTLIVNLGDQQLLEADSLVAATFTSGGLTHGVKMMSIESIIGSAGNDSIVGDANANRFEGGGGNDTLQGGGGDDTLIGGAGSDSMSGGDGVDMVDYAYVTGALTINLNAMATSTGHAQNDIIDTDVEIIRGSGTGANTFTSRDAVAVTLIGGAANDTFNARAAATRYEGGGGQDTVTYSQSTSAVTVDLTPVPPPGTPVGSGGYAAGDTYDSIEVIVGSSQGDTLRAGTTGMNFDGGAGDDTLIGGAGNDTLIAGVGNDSLMGSAGNDTLDLRAGNTTLVGDFANGGDNDDTVIIAQAHMGAGIYSIQGGGGTDTLQFHASAAGDLNLETLFTANEAKFDSFERLDLTQDGVLSTVIVTSASIRSLVDQGNSSLLTIRLSTGENYTFNMAGRESVISSGNLHTFRDAGSNTVAQVQFEYA